MYAHTLTQRQRTRGTHLPAFSMDQCPRFAVFNGLDFTSGSDQFFRTTDHRRVARAQGHAAAEQYDRCGAGCQAEKQRQRYAEAGHVAIEKQQATGNESNDSADTQDAKGCLLYTSRLPAVPLSPWSSRPVASWSNRGSSVAVALRG